MIAEERKLFFSFLFFSLYIGALTFLPPDSLNKLEHWFSQYIGLWHTVWHCVQDINGFHRPNTASFQLEYTLIILCWDIIMNISNLIIHHNNLIQAQKLSLSD